MEETTKKIYEWLEISGFKFGDASKIPLSVSLIEEELQELKDGIKNTDRKEVLNACVDLWWVICNAAYFVGIKTEELKAEFEAVEASNFSKYCKTLEEAQITVEAYATGTHPNKLGTVIKTEIVRTKSKEYPFVVVRTDGKILKSINFRD